MTDIKTIGISTGGGDCPGLNAVIRAATRSAILKHGWRVLGITDGLDGLIWPERSRELTMESVSGILPRGGTILGTTNRGNPFRYKMVENGVEVVRDLGPQVIENARRLRLDAVIVIGGDGTQAIALQLFRLGMNVVGVPKTIDNDLCATDVTFGFDTALHTCTDAIGKKFTIVVVAEGIRPGSDLKARFDEEKRRYPRAGAAGNLIGDALGMSTRKDVRVTVLGHVQRGGSPSPFDRILSTRFGAEAVELIARGDFGKMVALRGARIETVDIAEAVGAMKRVDPQGELVRIAKAVGVCFGD